MLSREGCYIFKPVIEVVYDSSNRRKIITDRRDWLPAQETQVGRGFFEDGKPGIAFFNTATSSIDLVGLELVHWLRIPMDKVFDNEIEEFFFVLFNRREWYITLEDGEFLAKFSD